ncbi:MAG TPA: tRNA uridine-5-carboxymethylaminomethyl(34) synthesis enzyme MnmG [Bacillota bacterium]|nr:tRNA uridine-5-carboxymethylaminomethyl(34) synthesis enzyme MnmG [Bacillota bacterium]
MAELQYDVIVVGAGHAGCEAALAAARLGAKTLMMTISPDTIAAMSCNPAIGGPAAKSHLVREIDALGGEMGRNIDRSYVNIRRLNESRGPAVLALRAQADKKIYQGEMILRLEQQPNLSVKQGLVTEILTHHHQVTGIGLKSGRKYFGKTVILATGTFLNGQIVMGNIKYPGGRQGEPAAVELSQSLAKAGLKLRRFQTATPPRIHRQTIDFKQLIPQPLQEPEWGFSWDGLPGRREQKPCWYTTTTPATIAVIQKNINLSPIRSGAINSKGPHFCPSIDRKVINFPDKTDHLIFLEPEGSFTEEVYLLGLTTAMPEEVQEQILATIPGLERVEIIRPGYAVEYDCLDSFQFKASLESKVVENMFSAGQINGTSGYEEAAAQGVIAGINAVRKISGQQPFIPDRTSSYIGVLIDDLVVKGTDEPYRMMTSLAEFRLFLRLDNALNRLGLLGYALGLIPEERWTRFKALLDSQDELLGYLDLVKIKADSELWPKLNLAAPNRGYRLKELILRPEIHEAILLECFPDLHRFTQPVREYVWNELKLDGYLKRQSFQVQAARELEAQALPEGISFQTISGLTQEAREALERVKPLTLGQAFRIPELEEADRLVLTLNFKQKAM